MDFSRLALGFQVSKIICSSRFMHEKFRLGTMEKEFRTPPHPQKKPQNKKKTHVFEEKTNMYIILRQEKQTFILRYSGKHQVLCVISEHLILSKSKNLPSKFLKSMVKVKLLISYLEKAFIDFANIKVIFCKSL